MTVLMLKIIAFISVLFILYGGKNDKKHIKYTGYGMALILALIMVFCL